MHLVSLSLYSLKRCCLTKSLFNKSGIVSWGFSSRKQRLGDMSLTLLQPYLPSLIVTLFEIHASVEFDVFLSVEACCLFCISLHTNWAICLLLTSFRVNMTHLSLSCPSTRNWNTISFYFSAKSIAFLFCRSTAVEIFNITHLFLSCQSARNWNTISISSLVFLFFGLSRYSSSIHIVLHWYWFVLYSAIPITTLRFSQGKTRCLFTILNFLFVHYFEFSVCANILLSLDVCSLFRKFCLFSNSNIPLSLDVVNPLNCAAQTHWEHYPQHLWKYH